MHISDLHQINIAVYICSDTLSKTARIRLRMLGIPRSASVIASGHNGKAGHAIAVKLRGSTNLGCCSQQNRSL